MNKLHQSASIKELIQQVFGDEMPISGGTGNSIEKAIVIKRTKPLNDYVSIQYHVIRYIALGRCYHSWNIIKQQLLFQDGKIYDKIEVNVIMNHNGKLLQQTEFYYFDITECYGPEKEISSEEDKRLTEMKLFLDNLNDLIEKKVTHSTTG
jgi:hypothetical protein